MPTDYDVVRRNADDTADESLAALTHASTLGAAVRDVEDDADDGIVELPGADLSLEELTVQVVPKQADEFTCDSCFLVYHRSRLAPGPGGRQRCLDCV